MKRCHVLPARFKRDGVDWRLGAADILRVELCLRCDHEQGAFGGIARDLPLTFAESKRRVVAEHAGSKYAAHIRTYFYRTLSVLGEVSFRRIAASFDVEQRRARSPDRSNRHLTPRSEEHTSELQSRGLLVCR